MMTQHRHLVALAACVLGVAACQTGEAAEEQGPTLITAVASRGD